MANGWENHPEYGGPNPSPWAYLTVALIAATLGLAFGLWPLATAFLR